MAYRQSGWRSAEKGAMVALMISILIHGAGVGFSAWINPTLPLQGGSAGRAAKPLTVTLVSAPDALDSERSRVKQWTTPVLPHQPAASINPQPTKPALATQSSPIKRIVRQSLPRRDRPVRLNPVDLAQNSVFQNSSSSPSGPVLAAPVLADAVSGMPEKKATAITLDSATKERPTVGLASRGRESQVSPDLPGSLQKSGLAGSSALLKLSLSRLVAKQFTYPTLARRRGWQGRVVVAVRVERSGLLSQVEVVESSGFGVLDQSAARTVSRLVRIPSALAATLTGPIQLHLPIIFQLEG
ncbi:MAG: TonB family protein [Magnetococcales bacterium]|nr:TonB family protein [Magnetococcales bacterium]